MDLTWHVHFDLRSPDFGAKTADLYAAALDMAAWADDHGAMAIVLSEHHGSPDGYLPSALTMAAAVAARTSSSSISVNALPLTLHDPVAVAEQVAVVDLLSGGRLALTVVPGYVDTEFAMFGVEASTRGRLLDEHLDVLLRALAGERFEWRGRQVWVRPAAPTVSRPLVLVGGSSPAAARRAARSGSGFAPTSNDPRLLEAYAAACHDLGRPPGLVLAPTMPLSVHVSTDPERSWEVLRPHAQHELAAYRAWAANDPGSPYHQWADVDAARAAGLWAVVTPEEAVTIARTNGYLTLKPLLAGLDPEEGWSSMRLVIEQVAPLLDGPEGEETPPR